jgi:hypothetical protein
VDIGFTGNVNINSNSGCSTISLFAPYEERREHWLQLSRGRHFFDDSLVSNKAFSTVAIVCIQGFTGSMAEQFKCLN